MDVSITTLHQELSSWIERAIAGENVVVTDGGIPVARIVAVDSTPQIDRATRRGLLSGVSTTRPRARGATRARSDGSVSELICEQRR
ncbi:type II toxin-antitoxin system Phd/YefM family antitoxin [Nakamurella sp. GG22]